MVAVAALSGTATASNAVVLYSYVGQSTQDFFDAGKQAVTTLVYDVKWAATFADFVTTEASVLFDSCSITPVSASVFPVTKTCGTTLTLSNFSSGDIAGYAYSWPQYNLGGIDGEVFESGAFLSPGVRDARAIGASGIATVGKLTVKDLSVVNPPVSSVPLPAAGLLLVGALGGLAAMRRRKIA